MEFFVLISNVVGNDQWFETGISFPGQVFFSICNFLKAGDFSYRRNDVWKFLIVSVALPICKDYFNHYEDSIGCALRHLEQRFLAANEKSP